MTEDDLKFCTPGQQLAKRSDEVTGGDGTYMRQGYICSSLAGVLYMDDSKQPTVVEVRRIGAGAKVVPQPNTIVTAMVTHISSKFAKCQITDVERSKLSSTFHGNLRKEDIQAVDRDKAEMHRCYRTGDIIVARVQSLGESQVYNLSTAEDELGVVKAFCEDGHPMAPSSWSEMKCELCDVTEDRKVARVPHVK